MRSIVVSKLGLANNLRIESAADPVPGAGQVSIKVSFVGMGGIDTIMRRGDLGALNPQPPFTLGLEISGIVNAVGDGVDDFAINDRVAALLLLQMGGYADTVICNVENVVHLPEAVELSSGAMLVNAVTALYVLDGLALTNDAHIVVHGASGGLGASFRRLARAAHPSTKLTGTVRSEAKKAEAQKSGFADVLTLNEFADRIDSGVRYDHVIDPVGGDLRRLSLTALKPFGSLTCLGNVSDDAESLIASQTIWLNSLTVRGFNLGFFNTQQPATVRDCATRVMSYVAAGKLDLKPQRIFAFEDIVTAHEYLESAQASGQSLLRV
jgi:NADPH2:quinone reductase